MRTAIFLLAAAALAGGCAAEMAMLSPSPVVTLVIEPTDGATAWGGRDITVAVQDPGRMFNDEGRADLPTHFYIHSWPEGTAIPVTTETIAGPTEWQWAIRVMPALSLSDDRWYVVGASDVSPRILSTAKLPDGTIGARFSPGSHPRVASVQFCEKEAPGMKLILNLSEPVTPPADPTQTVTVTVDGQSAACESTSAEASALSFTCDELSPAASVQVSVAAGMASPDGVALDPASWSIDVSQLPAGSCRTYTPDINAGP